MTLFGTDRIHSYSHLLLLLILSLALLGACELSGSFDDEFEPNDSINEAYPIELGESYSAYITQDDVDFFEFYTEHGSDTFDEVEIRVTDVGSDLVISVAVYDSDRELVYQSNSRTEGASHTSVLRDLQSDGPYYVRFSGTWPHSFDIDGAGDHRSTGRYTFTVQNLNANDEFAGNHSIEDAHPIEPGQNYDGVLVSDHEADYYSFTPSSDEMALAVTQAGSELVVGVALYGPNRQILGSQNTNTPGALLNINLNNMDTSATYYLRFSGTWPHDYEVGGIGDHQARGPYSFSVHDVD